MQAIHRWHIPVNGKNRKYLFLTDNLHTDAHITSLLNYVLNIIGAAVTGITRYSYTANSETVHDENGNPVTFEEMAYRYKGLSPYHNRKWVLLSKYKKCIFSKRWHRVRLLQQSL